MVYHWRMTRLVAGMAFAALLLPRLAAAQEFDPGSPNPQQAPDEQQIQEREQAQKLPSIVKVEFEPGLAGINARFDPSRMYRVIVNFLTNASEAMVGKGDDPAKFATSDPKIVISSAIAKCGIEIACADNGPGIPDEVLSKIREPLFTTKTFGIGLGLPAVEKILDEHGGSLRIETQTGHGTRMTACIPTKLERRDAA